MDSVEVKVQLVSFAINAIQKRKLRWSIFLINLQSCGPATQAFSTEIYEIFKSTYF